MSTARGNSGHPTADKVANRCQGQNREGKQCGWGAMSGLSVCRHHIAKAMPDQLAKVSTVDRLRDLSSKALDRLEQVILTGDDRDAVRASAIILDRVIPKPPSTAALIINNGPDAVHNGESGPTTVDLVRQRLASIRANQQAIKQVDADLDAEMQMPPASTPAPGNVNRWPELVPPAVELAADGSEIVEGVLEPDPAPPVVLPIRPQDRPDYRLPRKYERRIPEYELRRMNALGLQRR